MAVDTELQREPDNRTIPTPSVVLSTARWWAASIARRLALFSLLYWTPSANQCASSPRAAVGGWRRPAGDEGRCGVKLEKAPSHTGPRGSKATATRLGIYAGHHYTKYVEVVKDVKRRGDCVAAETLLPRLMEVIEEESRLQQWNAPPWYTERLAIIYCKQKNYEAEVAILERHKSLAETTGRRTLKLLSAAW